jgi:hypothetical protein
MPMYLTQHQYEEITGIKYHELCHLTEEEKNRVENFMRDVLKKYEPLSGEPVSFETLIRPASDVLYETMYD